MGQCILCSEAHRIDEKYEDESSSPTEEEVFKLCLEHKSIACMQEDSFAVRGNILSSGNDASCHEMHHFTYENKSEDREGSIMINTQYATKYGTKITTL